MKIIGIIGGLSPESTSLYYKQINDLVRERLGGHHSARIVLWSVDFGEFCDLKEKGDWATQGRLLTEAAQKLEQAGADFIVMATNTMHKMADEIQAGIKIPLVHLADATADTAMARGIKTVAFLGTKYSMQMDFYTGRLKERGLTVIVPEREEDQLVISDIIYDELTKGIKTPEAESAYVQVINDLKTQGAEAVILGCTEITYLIGDHNSPLPTLDTTRIHVEKAVELALG